MTDQEMLNWIDNAPYEALLRKWRFAPAGDPFFAGEMGDYYGNALRKKREADPEGAVRASKKIGWDE